MEFSLQNMHCKAFYVSSSRVAHPAVPTVKKHVWKSGRCHFTIDKFYSNMLGNPSFLGGWCGIFYQHERKEPIRYWWLTCWMGVSGWLSPKGCGGRKSGKWSQRNTLPKTNIAPENGWLEDKFSFGMAYFQVRTVSFREGRDALFLQLETPRCGFQHPIDASTGFSSAGVCWNVFCSQGIRGRYPCLVRA